VEDPDEIKQQFGEYQQILQAGDSRAAATVHEESSAVSKRVLGEAMQQRRDIVYDVTLGNPIKGRALIDNAKSAGYEVRLYGVTVDPETAVRRNAERAAVTKLGSTAPNSSTRTGKRPAPLPSRRTAANCGSSDRLSTRPSSRRRRSTPPQQDPMSCTLRRTRQNCSLGAELGPIGMCSTTVAGCR
jgi:hypothetical protein